MSVLAALVQRGKQVKHVHVVARWEAPIMEEKCVNEQKNKSLQRRMKGTVTGWW